MRRPARRDRDRRRNEAVLGRREIGAAAGDEIGRLHLGDEIIQPIRIGDAVAVGIGDDLAGRGFGADIARDAEAFVRLRDDLAVAEALGDGEAAIGRAVIDDDHLVIGIIELRERFEAGRHRALGVVGADHDRDARRARQRGRDRSLIARAHGRKRRLRIAVTIDEAESPILDQMTAGEPFIGPGEDAGTGDAHLESGAELPGQDAHLLVIAFAHRIDAELGQHQRPVDGEVVQPRHVFAEGMLVMEIDVEAEEVGEIDRQIFGRREIRVGDEPLGIDVLDEADELLEEGADVVRPVPAHHVGRDLVADQESEDRRMAIHRAHGLDHGALDVALDLGAVEEGDVLRPRHADQHLEAMIVGEVEQPDRRRREDADRVDAGLGHHAEIALGNLALGELAAMRADGKGPVGHAFDEELLFADEEEFALHADRLAAGRGARAFLWRDGRIRRHQWAAPFDCVLGVLAKRF